MEEDKEKLPSLPPNYVTILQLQERWIKERKQKGKGVQVSEKSEVAVCVVGCESTEKNIEIEGLKKNVRKGRNWKKRRQKRKGTARTEDEENGSEARAPQTSVVMEESIKSINVVLTDSSGEIEGKFNDMSISNGRETGSDRFVRPHDRSLYRVKNGGNRRGNCEHGSDYRRFRKGRGLEWKTRNAGMVWVKKGEVSGVNDGGVQGSSCSLKESE